MELLPAVAAASDDSGPPSSGDGPRTPPSDSCPDPDLEAAAIHIAMHPVTGAFTDPAHESGFGVHLFRLAFPFHVLLLLLCNSIGVFMLFNVTPEARPLWAIFTAVGLFSLVSRLLLHCMHDSVRSQQLGSRFWTFTMLLCTCVDSIGNAMASAYICIPTEEKYLASVFLIATTLMNGSHGMGFAHKNALVGGLLVDNLILVINCGRISVGVALVQTGVILVSATAANVAELYMRQGYAERKEKTLLEQRAKKAARQLAVRNEQLQAEKERLMYDVQRRTGRALDDDDARSAIRRGLQAEHSQPTHPARDADLSVSEAGGPAPSDAAPPSLPPGAPSSTAGGSSVGQLSNGQLPLPLTWGEADQPGHAESAGSPVREVRRASPGSKRSRLGAPDEDREMLLPPKDTDTDTSSSSSSCSRPKSKGKQKRQFVPLSWAEADRQHFAEVAGRSGVEQRSAPLSWATKAEKRSLSACNEQESVQEAWAEGDRQYFAAVAARAANEQRARDSVNAQVPLSWAEADRQWHAERAASRAVTAPKTKRVISSKEASRLCRELRQLAKGERSLPLAQTEEAEMAAMAELVDDEVVDSLAPHII